MPPGPGVRHLTPTGTSPAGGRDTGRVLVVDDDADMCRFLAAGLSQRGFEVSWETSAAAALEVLGTAAVEAIVTDLSMDGMNGLELCSQIATNRPDIPVIVLTAFGSLETAVAAIRAGAYDFITKPPEIEALAFALERALRHQRLRAEVTRLRGAVEAAHGFGEFVGASRPMQRVYDLIEQVADTGASVLITGESGTGKELAARALHRRGRRRDGPFVAVNCAAVPETLLESELFGHVRGAFTDARTARAGLFPQANGGTLLLDEIDELPWVLQPKLLRVLQEHTVRPVGGDTEVPCDVRVVAAANGDLESAVEEKRFREDLYYRINVIQIVMPPLRTRGNDILLLAQHFLDRSRAQTGKRVVGISPPAAERLLGYPWPGNVRELQNCVERAVALASHDEIVVDDFPERVRSHRAVAVPESAAELLPLEEVERRHILRVVEAVNGNRTLAAQILGLDRKTLYRKLERYGARG